jgi:hypothetical protein
MLFVWFGFEGCAGWRGIKGRREKRPGWFGGRFAYGRAGRGMRNEE